MAHPNPHLKSESSKKPMKLLAFYGLVAFIVALLAVALFTHFEKRDRVITQAPVETQR